MKALQNALIHDKKSLDEFLEHLSPEDRQDIIFIKSACRTDYEKAQDSYTALMGDDNTVYLGKTDNYHNLSLRDTTTAFYDNSEHDLQNLGKDDEVYYMLYGSGYDTDFEAVFHENQLGGYDYLKKVCDTLEAIEAKGFTRKKPFCLNHTPLNHDTLSEAYQAYQESDLCKGTKRLADVLGASDYLSQAEACEKLLKKGLSKLLTGERNADTMKAISEHLVSCSLDDRVEQGFQRAFDVQRVAARAVAVLPEDAKVDEKMIQNALLSELQNGKLPHEIPEKRRPLVERFQKYLQTAEPRRIYKEVQYLAKRGNISRINELPVRNTALFR